jgi:hypothetical protein
MSVFFTSVDEMIKKKAKELEEVRAGQRELRLVQHAD